MALSFGLIGCGGFGEHISKILHELPHAHIAAASRKTHSGYDCPDAVHISPKTGKMAQLLLLENS